MEPISSKRARFSPASWSDLPQELVVIIARRIGSAQDFVAFGAVCKHWRRAFTKQDFLGGITHEVPFLMIPRNSCSTPLWCNLSRGRFCRLDISFTKYKAKQPMPPCWDSCRSSLGWLILRPQTRDLLKRRKRAVYMFDPFNHTKRIDLPSYGRSIKKFVLSSSPSLPSDYIAMVSYPETKRVAFWRPKDKVWRDVALPRWPYNVSCFDDIAFYKGHFYMVQRASLYSIIKQRESLYGGIYVCDINEHTAEARHLALGKFLNLCTDGTRSVQLYLVESAGELLVVSRYYSESCNETVGFRVFKVPFNAGDWTEVTVTDLGSRALFLGDNSSSFSVEISPGYSRCKANCIYFTTDRG